MTLVSYIAYLIFVKISDNSNFLSLSTLLVTLGGAAIIFLKEIASKRRWWIIIQYVILSLILFYLFYHKWQVHSRMHG